MTLTWNLGQQLNLTRETQQRQKIDDDVISTNSDVIVIFSFYGQFAVIRKLDSKGMICKSYILISSNLLYHKTWKQN